jgi:predicted acetyltransferase
VELEEARDLEPGVFDRARRGQPGAVSRFDAWWPDEQFQPAFGSRFDVVYESPDGSVDGYLTYGMRAEGTIHGPAYRLTTRELVAVDAVAEYALFRYACEVDLVRTVVVLNAPLDFAGPWTLATPRAAEQTSVRDFLWTRLLDVPTALAARTYAVPQGDAACLVLDVRDAFRPGGRAEGRFALEGGPTEPDLVLEVAALSAAWLGGVTFSTLGRANRVVEVRAGALARADTMFASNPLPAALTWF